MTDLIESILKGDFATANKLVNEQMEEIVEMRLLEERKRIASISYIDEANTPEQAAKKARFHAARYDVLGKTYQDRVAQSKDAEFNGDDQGKTYYKGLARKASRQMQWHGRAERAGKKIAGITEGIGIKLTSDGED